MHEKKDVWKTDGIGIGRGYGIVGLRTEWGKLRYIDSGFKGGDISFIRIWQRVLRLWMTQSTNLNCGKA